jgi:hypothetical protein
LRDRDDQLLTVADIAGHVGDHEQTLRGWIHRGELKVSTFGARIGYRIRCGPAHQRRSRAAPAPCSEAAAVLP